MRRVSTDFKPDIRKVRELVKKAVGDRTLVCFARAAGINYSYICKYVNGGFDRPLMPATLLKIASAAWNGVTAKELLTASGYSADKYVYELQLAGVGATKEKPLLLEELHERIFLKKAAYLWFIQKKDFANAEVRDDGGPVVLMRSNGEEWMLFFLLERDGRNDAAWDAIQRSNIKFSSENEQEHHLCYIVDNLQKCKRKIILPMNGNMGTILIVDPYTGGIKEYGGAT